MYASYPAGENSAWLDSIFVGANLQNARWPAPAHTRNGARTRLRLQVLPDGRCGVALNGSPVFVSHDRALQGPDARAVIHGSSHQTEGRVGRVTISRGVPNDIDWAGYERGQH